jgi:hypothetical protein
MYFKTIGPFKWQITDKYGDDISKDQLRDIKLDEVLDNQMKDVFGKPLSIIYNMTLRKIGGGFGYGLYSASWSENTKLLSVYSLGDDSGSEGVKVKLPCNSINDVEPLIRMVCKGNGLEVMPAFLI